MRLALAQTDIVWENKKANEKTAERMIKEAAEKGCRLIIFPEVSLTGFTMNIDILSEPGNSSETISFFSEQALKNKTYITFGVATTESDGMVRNRSVTVDPNGKVACSYAKIHPYSHGVEGRYFTGGNNVEWFDIDGVTISPFVCYDIRFPEIFQAASVKSKIITVIASWPDERLKYFDLFLKARAVENQSFFIGVNRTGYEMKYHYSGHSQVVSPTGDVLTEIRTDEALIICDIDPKESDDFRRSFDLKKNRRPELYKKLL